MLLPAIETHVVLITIIPGADAAAAAGDDVDGASGGIVDGEIRGGLVANVDGAGGAVWVATELKLGVEWNYFCE